MSVVICLQHRPVSRLLSFHHQKDWLEYIWCHFLLLCRPFFLMGILDQCCALFWIDEGEHHQINFVLQRSVYCGHNTRSGGLAGDCVLAPLQDLAGKRAVNGCCRVRGFWQARAGRRSWVFLTSSNKYVSAEARSARTTSLTPPTPPYSRLCRHCR